MTKKRTNPNKRAELAEKRAARSSSELKAYKKLIESGWQPPTK